MQPTRIKEKKLGREKAHGLHRQGSRYIEIDPRLKEFQRLMITLHEWMHRHDLASLDTHSRMEDDDMDAARAIEEADVDIHSKDLARMLWHAGYRRVRL